MDNNVLTADYGACFKDIYYFLYTNSSASRAESIVSDISKLLLYKFLLEKDPSADRTAYSGKEILETLCTRLPNRYSKDDKFQLTDNDIAYVMNKLNGIVLSKAPSHIIGDAFQSIIGPRIRGDKGQFFTPKELVECMVAIAAPGNSCVIVDPACGTGGFLSEAFAQMTSKDGANGQALRLIGIDKDRDMADMAFAAAKILTGENAEIFNANSLEIIKKDHPLNYLLGMADYVFTNPPFGAKIGVTDEKILSLFELGHNWTYSDKDNKWYHLDSLLKNQAPQILFLELCVRLLKNGGKMAVVLPEGVFGNKSLGYIWDYLKRQGNVSAMIDCPRNTFQPSTDTKTNVLFFEKGVKYTGEVPVAVAVNCGHDKRGRTRNSQNEPWPNDFTQIAKGFTLTENKIKNNRWRRVKLSGTYFVPRYLAGKNAHMDQKQYITIGTMIEKGYLRKKNSQEIGSESYGTGDIPFVRTSDINNYEISADPTNSVSEEIYNRYAKQQNLEVGDILFIADGRYRIGKTAIITKYNIKCLIQSHIEILSLTDKAPFSPFEFLYSLNTSEVQEQIRSMVFIQSTLGTLGSRINEISIPLPAADKEWDQKIHAFQYNIEMRAECLSNLRDSEHTFEL